MTSGKLKSAVRWQKIFHISYSPCFTEDELWLSVLLSNLCTVLYHVNSVLIFFKEDWNSHQYQFLSFTARKHGLSEVSQEVYNLVSHATQERLRNILEKLSTISLHRLEVYRVCSITTTNNVKKIINLIYSGLALSNSYW